MAEFDPYYEWLGIQPHERPADHYLLLGLERFETDSARIRLAADQRVTYLRSLQSGPRGGFTQNLLNELSQARICLLDGDRKAAYDRELRGPLPLPMAAPTATAPMAKLASAPAIAEPEPPPAAAPDSPGDEDELGGRTWFPAILTAGVLLVATLAWAVFAVSRKRQEELQENPVTQTAQVEPAKEPSKSAKTKQPRKRDFKNRPMAMQEQDGTIHFSALPAELSGDALKFRDDGQGGLIDGWRVAGDEANWAFRITTPAYFQVDFTYATGADPKGSLMLLEIGDQIKKIRLRKSGGKTEFITDTYYFLIRRSGNYILALRPAKSFGKPKLLVRKIRMTPKSK